MREGLRKLKTERRKATKQRAKGKNGLGSRKSQETEGTSWNKGIERCGTGAVSTLRAPIERWNDGTMERGWNEATLRNRIGYQDQQRRNEGNWNASVQGLNI